MISSYERNMSSAIPWSIILGSEENHADLLRKHFKGSLNITAQHLGVSLNGLIRKIRIEEITLPTKEKIAEKIAKLGEATHNMTSTEIAKAVDCTQEYVTTLCRRNNIQYKKRNRLHNLLGVQRKEMTDAEM